MGNVHAAITLARAYDRAGDDKKACDANAEFVGRFGKHPGSISVKLARERMKALSCR
jgi:hypothetical protein